MPGVELLTNYGPEAESPPAPLYSGPEVALLIVGDWAGPGMYRPISVYRFPCRALTLCPQLYMGIQPGARFPARSADALPETLYGHFP